MNTLSPPLLPSHAELKGGALISALYAYSQHGDFSVNTLIKNLLTQVFYNKHSLNVLFIQHIAISVCLWRGLL